MAKKNCKTPYKDFIERPEISFWLPILFTAVSITVSFMALSSQVALQNQKLDTLLAGQDNLIEKYEGVQARLGNAEKIISIIQYKEGI